MDHKVSKDMISSGMIPSGEKTQADLSRTQYGSAPSPSKLMDAYKSMYDKKEEVINEMKMGDVSGSADFASRNIKGAKGAAPAPKPAPKPETKTEKPKTETDDMLDKVRDRRVEKAVNRDKDVRRARASYIMTKYGESIDLLAAYRSIYEHHKKDADGNTIPHEDEEVSEGKIPAGLQAYLDKKKGKKEDKEEVKEGLGAAVKMALKSVSKIAKSETGKRLVGDMARGAAQQFGARMVSGGSGGQQKQNTAGKASAGSYQAASADLFDIVKGQLLDEGLSEEEIKDIMLTLTPDEILNEISVGKMGDYISAASKDVQKTSSSIDKDSDSGKKITSDDPRIDKMSKRTKSMAMAGTKIAKKLTPSPLPRTEEYKNFDPKKPDPKQMAAQAKQEKNRQKFNDPMGVKNKNIGGQGLDPMDK